MKKLLSLLASISFLLSACGPTDATSTGESVAASTVQAATKTPKPGPTVSAVTNLGVNSESLKGVEVKVWYPWYGVESNLFGTLVAEFNEKNEWGIKVIAESQINFTNLYENTTAALPTTGRPDMVIALPEHALGWDANGIVTDLAPYVQDPLYGIDSSEIPNVFWNQDYFDSKRLGIPAQRTARFLLWNETWAGEIGFSSPPDAPDDFKQQACEKEAKTEVRKYRRKGPAKQTRLLLDAIRSLRIKNVALLDIGGGIGAIHHELLGDVARTATHVDASSAYLKEAREEATRRGHHARVTFIHADFTDVASNLPRADVVTLDRVVCCYPDFRRLLLAAADRSQRALALTYPRETWFLRLACPEHKLFAKVSQGSLPHFSSPALRNGFTP